MTEMWNAPANISGSYNSVNIMTLWIILIDLLEQLNNEKCGCSTLSTIIVWKRQPLHERCKIFSGHKSPTDVFLELLQQQFQQSHPSNYTLIGSLLFDWVVLKLSRNKDSHLIIFYPRVPNLIGFLLSDVVLIKVNEPLDQNRHTFFHWVTNGWN